MNEPHIPVEPLEWLQELLVRSLLSDTAKTQFKHGAIADRELAPYAAALQDISKRYLRLISERRETVSNAVEATAYALYYTPINFAKISFLLNELYPSGSKKPARILDFGSGPGSASLASIHRFGDAIEMVAVESSAPMAKLYERLFTEALPNARPEIHHDLSSVSGAFDLIILGNVLNELSPSQAERLLVLLSEMLTTGGRLLILEPGSQEPTLNLMEKRDFLLAACPALSVCYPCTHNQNCPMLAQHDEEWCHGTLQWTPPQLVDQFDRLTGFNKHRLKHSVIVFEKTPRITRSALRVVTIPIKNKIGICARLCGECRYEDFIFGKRVLASNINLKRRIYLHGVLEAADAPSPACMSHKRGAPRS